MAMIVAGVGCQSKCAAEEMLSLLRHAMTIARVCVGLIATTSDRAELAVIRCAAAELGIAVQPIDHPALAAVQSRCVTQSPRVQREVGLGSVAEAAALAAAGPNSRLLLPRIASARATCALAVSGE